ncbi:AbrB family transcriptional regulator [Hydrogenophaga sp.]|uniref:AbrB family transcriptional regulator n=1 Tax=Hydrogenophaga sp. TaxID=1904254 RepID=UPI0025C62983|nr:AbrB family transcriptional regulator [Hydrogenophaga sp.]MBT9463299.1 AbrB family transcriptional regulator [Hydrogenophaga sp.]
MAGPVGSLGWLAISALTAGLGGWLARGIGMPLPWVLGAMLAVALMALASGRTQRQPPLARRLAQGAIGASLGLYFTPAILAQTGALAPWIALGAASALVLSWLAAPVFQRLANCDGSTAIYAVALGASAEMALQAQRAGADAAVVASAHATRIILVTTSATLLAGLVGVPTSAGPVLPAGVLPWPQLLVLLAGAAAAALVLQRCRLPNPWLLGPVLVGGVCAAQGWNARLPDGLLVAAQVLIGWALGLNITRAFFARAPRVLLSAALVTLGILAVCLGLGWAIARGAGLPLMTGFVALVPGGMAEMGLIAKAFALGAPTVTAFHIVRIVTTIFLTQPMARWMLATGWVRA